jgi:hypothetical protein
VAPVNIHFQSQLNAGVLHTFECSDKIIFYVEKDFAVRNMYYNVTSAYFSVALNT